MASKSTTMDSKKQHHDIPTVSFRVIDDDKSLFLPAGVHSEQSRSYGYNDFSEFERPEHYMRYIEPIESELAVQVEYDMDEQDQEWLDVINVERKKDQSGPIPCEVFEILMDKLEKEWFSLIKRIPQPVTHLPPEDSKCSICDDGEGENSNAIVFCDGCNLAVHQDCYGVPYIPEGQWLCRKCTVSPENPVTCLFCPNEGGAFKQTTSMGHWSHLICAMWIPETGVGNAIYMEPVEGVEAVPKNRWKLVCSLCKERTGACIQCENKNCFVAFHVTCARQMGLLMSMKLMGPDGKLFAYCDKHFPAEWRDDGDDVEDDDYQESEEDDDDDDDFARPPPPPTKRVQKVRARAGSISRTVTTKTARAHAKSYRPGPPIVPRMIVNRLLDYVAKIAIRKRQPFIERLCRYWSLKREARRGAPLLKRLHLEPWTASNAARQETEAEKAKKLEFLMALRNDLEKVRMLAELVRKREKEKLRQVQVIKDVVDSFIYPHYSTLRLVLEKISAMDRGELFVHPVSRTEVPDYFDVIKEPMCWSWIDEKVEQNVYLNVDEFKRDVMLVLDNAMLYNKAETPFHRTAARIKKNAQPLLDGLDNIPQVSSLLPPPIEGGNEVELRASFIDPPVDSVGDLEPSILHLKTLLAPDTDEPFRDFLASVFTFEVEKPKPKSPTPPPPIPPVQKVKSRKSMSAAERKKLWEERDAKYKERLSMGGSTRQVARALADAADETASNNLGDDVDMTATPPPRAGPSRRRSLRRGGGVADNDDDNDTESSPGGSIRPPSKPQRGVAGVQSVRVLSDRERRNQERQLALVTEDIDAQDQYKRFNVGWILPEGSKRRRPVHNSSSSGGEQSHPSRVSRASQTSTAPLNDIDSIEQSATAAPPPSLPVRKRKRRGGVIIPAPADITAEPTTPPKLKPEHAAADDDDADADAEPSVKRRRIAQILDDDDDELTPAPDSEPPSATRSIASRPVPITSVATATADSEVTPTRKSRPRRRRRDKRSAATKEPGVAKEEDVATKAEVKRELANVELEEVSDGNSGGEESQSEDGDDNGEDGDDGVEEAAGDENATPTRPPPPRQRYVGIDEFPPGSQVWAKLTSYPYFPAIVVDHVEHWETVPQSVLDLEDEAAERAGPAGRPWLVRFYDRQRSYGWIQKDKLDKLGVDDEIDKMYLAGRDRGKTRGFKTSHVRTACRKAFREATAAASAAATAAGAAGSDVEEDDAVAEAD